MTKIQIINLCWCIAKIIAVIIGVVYCNKNWYFMSTFSRVINIIVIVWLLLGSLQDLQLVIANKTFEEYLKQFTK